MTRTMPSTPEESFVTGRDAIGSDEELGWLSACDLRDQYATGSLSPVEVLEAVLGAIDAWDARLHAFVTVCDEAAHESARRAAAEMQKDAEWPETRPLLGGAAPGEQAAGSPRHGV